jgi:hypothetical protein
MNEINKFTIKYPDYFYNLDGSFKENFPIKKPKQTNEQSTNTHKEN